MGWSWVLPSGKRWHNHGKSQFSCQINYFDWAIFNSYVKLPEGMSGCTVLSKTCFTSSDPRPGLLFWHSFRHSIWHSLRHLFSGILSGSFSGILSHMCSGPGVPASGAGDVVFGSKQTPRHPEIAEEEEKEGRVAPSLTHLAGEEKHYNKPPKFIISTSNYHWDFT